MRALCLLYLLGLMATQASVASPADNEAGAASPASNDAWALLVGVSEYPALSSDRQLRGPRHDVQALQATLRAVRPDWRAITTLADGVADAQGLPTRQAIVDALGRLQRQVRADDFVVIYFAGHGSQQPATDKQEADGLDEIFLPRDIGAWDGKQGRVRNAITDNEIDALLAGILAKGAQVWAIFDTCHSGTMTRGTLLGDHETARWVRPIELGIPATNGEVRLGVDAPKFVRPEHGSLTIFSAAQAFETTPELRLPPGDPKRTHRGLFTYTLTDVIGRLGPATYAQLAQTVLTRYAAMNRIAPTPVFDGDLDRPLPVVRAAVTARQHLTQVRVKVHGPVLCDSSISVAPCNGRLGDAADGKLRDRATRAMSNLSLGSGVQLERVADAELADLAVLAHEGRLWFVAPLDDYQRNQRTPTSLVPSDTDAALATQLARIIDPIATSRWLYGLAEGAPADVSLSVITRLCSEPSTPLDLSGNPRVLRAGQAVCIDLRNAGSGHADVTLLHLGENYSIETVFPVRGELNRLNPGAHRTIQLEVLADKTPSLDRLMILAVRGNENQPPTDFSWATQAGLPQVIRGGVSANRPVWVRTLRWIALPTP